MRLKAYQPHHHSQAHTQSQQLGPSQSACAPVPVWHLSRTAVPSNHVSLRSNIPRHSPRACADTRPQLSSARHRHGAPRKLQSPSHGLLPARVLRSCTLTPTQTPHTAPSATVQPARATQTEQATLSSHPPTAALTPFASPSQSYRETSRSPLTQAAGALQSLPLAQRAALASRPAPRGTRPWAHASVSPAVLKAHDRPR